MKPEIASSPQLPVGWNAASEQSDTVGRVNSEVTVARLGGDEFTILLENVKHAERRPFAWLNGFSIV